MTEGKRIVGVRPEREYSDKQKEGETAKTSKTVKDNERARYLWELKERCKAHGERTPDNRGSGELEKREKERE